MVRKKEPAHTKALFSVQDKEEKQEVELMEEKVLKDTFIIDNDNKAEWAINKIKEEQKERDRLIAVCEEKIQEYQEKIEKFKKQYENNTSYLISCLNQYFNTVEKKKTKTQETYQLPSGKLKLKYPSPEIKRDNEKLLKWLKNNKMTYFVDIKESPKWGELKKTISLAGDKYVTEDGEIVEGVTAVDRPPVFEVEV